jgi:hypothetical protein
MLENLKQIFWCLEKHQVKYLVIGGIAAALHGVPRATFDLDILIEATAKNAERLLEALAEAGLGTAGLVAPERLLKKEITVFEDWIRIDVQTKTPGVKFEQAWGRRETMDYQGQKMWVLTKNDLIASKRAAGRRIDLDDVKTLIKIKRNR